MLLTQIQRFKTSQKQGFNVHLFNAQYILGNRCQIVLNPGCCKPFFSSVMPGGAGLLTDPALHEEFAAICERGAWQGSPSICHEIQSMLKSDEPCMGGNELV